MKTYIDELTELKRSYSIATTEANSYTNPDLSAEGLAKKRAELAEKATNEYKGKLEALTSSFKRDAAMAKEAGLKAIPAAPGDTANVWARAKMLLDAGQSLQYIVAHADPAMLHALAEWGPTYLEAEAYKGRSDDWADVSVDAGPLQRSIQQRWGQVLGGNAPDRLAKAKEAEVAEAQFLPTAEHFASKLDGVATAADDWTAAIESKLAGQRAAADLSTDSKGGAAA